MLKSKYTAALCTVISVATLIITVLFTMGSSLGIVVQKPEMPYEEKLFSTDRVHSLDIVVDRSDWEAMLATATAEQYIQCNVVIDGDSVNSVGIRPKGNSSLVKAFQSDTERYGFKIEFDHYVSGRTYYGLDKLALNNIAQDYTYLKDYISFEMMREAGADTPLFSFIFIRVNGEDWGLYLAVEGIDKAFARRNYGADFGQIYKPDTAGMNEEQPERGGMTGGDEKSAVALQYIDDEIDSYHQIFDNAVFKPGSADKTRLLGALKQLNEGVDLEEVINIDEVLRYFAAHNFVLNFDSYTGSLMHNYYLHEAEGRLSMIPWDYNLAFGGFDRGGGGRPAFRPEGPETTAIAPAGGAPGGTGGGAAGRSSVPAPSGNERANGDGGNAAAGWGGTRTSVITWVNFPIDTPVFGAAIENRPLLRELLADEGYLEKYHQLFGGFIRSYFDSGNFVKSLDRTVALISPFVEKDPSAFCTYNDFLAAQKVLREFCLLRAESVKGQLEGTIASTNEGQQKSGNAGFIEASLADGSALDFNRMGNSFVSYNRIR
ncbi:hypothetical protein FACS189476_00330 [Spirochaetia bacterium]|nr:hypothetical protein FACS189476_00330 [Spirochaetia bacterium]